MAELRRRQGFARSYGIDGHASCSRRRGRRARSRCSTRTRSSARTSFRATASRRRCGSSRRSRAKASARGVTFEGGVTVTGFDIQDGRVHGVQTDRGRDRVRARADLRGDLGPDRRRAGRRADPARRRPTPAGVDRPDPRAGGRDARGRAPDPAPPGPRDVLPPPRGPLRRRQLPPRADRHAAARHPPSRRRPDAVADAVHAGGLRLRRARDRAAAPRARRSDAARAIRNVRSTGCSRSRPTPAPSWANRRRSAASGSARRCGSRTAAGWDSRSPSGW